EELSRHGLGFSLRIDVPGFAPFELARGSTSPDGSGRITPNTLLRIGSVTKTMTAVGVLKLVDQGRLSLDDTLEEFVPNCPNGGEITVRDLLAMSSGLPEYTDGAFVFEWIDAPTAPYSTLDTIAAIRAGKPIFEPSSEVVYTNSNYVLLGEIIEIAAGAPWNSWEDWLMANVISPAGLTSTVIPKNQDTTLPRGAAGGWYFFEIDEPSRESPARGWHDTSLQTPDYAASAGNAFSTAADLSRWLDVLTTGALLTNKTFAEQMTFRPLSGVEGSEYGLGLLRGGGLLGHSGEVLGSKSEMYLVPDLGVKIIIIAEGGDDDFAPADYIGDLLGAVLEWRR
ncbi:MAG: hypothetical protein RL591_2562, partial [Planctomycetota bacterium]